MLPLDAIFLLIALCMLVLLFTVYLALDVRLCACYFSTGKVTGDLHVIKHYETRGSSLPLDGAVMLQ